MADESVSSSPGLLQQVFLAGVNFERRLEYDFPEQLTYSIDTETTAKFIGDNHSVVQGLLHATIHWHRPEESEEVDGPFTIDITVGSVFVWRFPEQTEEDILGWIEFNCTHLLWPYLRSYISMISGASGVPPLTIFTIQAPRPTLGQPAEAPPQIAENAENH